MKEKSYCKCCGAEIKNEYQPCCIYRKVLNNFTGEFNTWDEIGDEIIKIYREKFTPKGENKGDEGKCRK